MESMGAIKIVNTLASKHDLKLTHYLGDGDCRAFANVSKGVPWTMEKLECTNHVSKRISARLRKKKNELCLKGKGKLTEAAINRLTMIATQQNANITLLIRMG